MSNLSPTAAATRQTFIYVFCEMYQSKPIDKITVAELARRAGYNRQTFYEYFVSVYDLLEQIEDELIDHIGERISNTITNGRFVDIFPEVFADMQHDFERHPLILLTSEHATKFPVKLKKAIVPVIMSAFRIPPEDTKAVYALDFYLSGVISIMSDWLQNGSELSADELGSLIRSILTEGVLDAIGQVDEKNR